MTKRILLAAVLGFSASSAAAPALEKKDVKIAVGGKTLFYYLPLTLADRLGYFKDEGLEVEIVDFAGGAKSLQALIGGSADFVSGAFEHTINMHAAGFPRWASRSRRATPRSRWVCPRRARPRTSRRRT